MSLVPPGVVLVLWPEAQPHTIDQMLRGSDHRG
jgi:hypothetical protein